jgi:2-polyprenyl-3-methyl-5-hydroxy-6-metoxy-1,4-benzoquinol methylase
MKCKICKTGDLRFHSNARDYWVTNEEYRLLECDACHVVSTEIQLTGDFFNKYYQSSYYAHTEESIKLGLREQLQIDSVKIRLGEKLSLFRRTRAYFLAGIALINLPAIRNGKILDVGCGSGKLLRVAASVGYECHGVEPSEHARNILMANGVMAYASLFDVAVPLKYFDAIVFNQSIEHMPDPIAALQQALTMLNDDGVLIISVPNFSTNERHVFGNYWRHVDVPRHLFHFSPGVFEIIAKNNDLYIQKRVFKYWGYPSSTFQLAKEKEGLSAYSDMATWLVRQAISLIQLNRASYGQMMSYYCKVKNTTIEL